MFSAETADGESTYYGQYNFNSMEVEEELPATDGYVQYTCSGLWNGTGDFKLSFTGDIYLYIDVYKRQEEGRPCEKENHLR